MDAGLKDLVRQRAGDRCEYCQLDQIREPFLRFQIEHIIAKQHGGRSVASNLALSCHHCNLHKGPNISGIDSKTRRMVRLFHPRRHRWDRHFRWDGAVLIGRTAIGRTTVAVLNINAEDRVELRKFLIEEGLFSSP